MPRYNRDVQLDPSQVQDVRGRKLGGPIAVGGGGLGILITLIMLLLGGDPFGGGGSNPYGGLVDEGDGASAINECQTGADAESRQDCRLLLFVNSIQSYWTRAFSDSGQRYQPAITQFFSAQTQTGCGTASSQVGPIYCPSDTKVYIDIGFFDQLRDRLGAQGGDFAQAYVLAHEYGHHVQNLTGSLQEAQGGDTGPQSGAVRVELQADCYAGVWARNATQTGFFTELAEADIADALDAAAAVGDDRIQKTTTGRVNPEAWTHGSSAQRQKWFTAGYERGDPSACDTFAGAI
jgi:uncharacterized protein